MHSTVSVNSWVIPAIPSGIANREELTLEGVSASPLPTFSRGFSTPRNNPQASRHASLGVSYYADNDLTKMTYASAVKRAGSKMAYLMRGSYDAGYVRDPANASYLTIALRAHEPLPGKLPKGVDLIRLHDVAYIVGVAMSEAELTTRLHQAHPLYKSSQAPGYRCFPGYLGHGQTPRPGAA